MTDRVKQYIEIEIYDDMSNTEVNRLSKQKDRLKKNMTVEELESLKGKIDPREFLYGSFSRPGLSAPHGGLLSRCRAFKASR